MHLQRFLLIILISFFSCGETDKTVVAKSQTDTSMQATPVQDSFYGSDVKSDDYDENFDDEESKADTLVIDSRSAVFFQPDSLAIEKKFKELGDDFLVGMDDYLYYMHLSREHLEKKGVPIVDTKGYSYLKFLMADGSSQVVDLRKQEDLWGVYLFDPKTRPHYADILIIEEDYEKYLGQ